MKAVEEKRSIITFEEEEHLYHYKGTRLSSVTSALKPYFPFDMEGQLYRSAYQVLFGQDEWYFQVNSKISPHYFKSQLFEINWRVN